MIISSFDKVEIILFTNHIHLSYSFMKLDERCIRFVKSITTTTTDDQMTKIKVICLENLCNFVVQSFLI
jgi:hypothetical protein